MTAVTTIADRITAALSDPTPREAMKDVLSDLLENLREIEKQISFRIASLLVLLVANELLLSARITEVAAFGFKIEDISVVHRIVPVVIAYTYFAVISLIAGRRLIEEVYDTAFGHCFPELYDADIERYVRPHQTLKMLGTMSSQLSGVTRTLIAINVKSIMVVLLFMPPVYLLWTCLRVIIKYGANDILTIICSVFAFLLLAQSAFVVYSSVKATNDTLF